MCFSASVSFGAGVVLSAVGVAAIKKTEIPSQVPFASIPLIFAVQQFTEGFLWLALTHPEFAQLQQVMTYNFLFFAQVVWPAWVPFAIMKLEPPHNRRTMEKVLVGIGAFISALLLFCLVTYPISANVDGHHVKYVQDYPQILKYGSVLYILATIGPPFFSRVKNMWVLGLTIMISYILTTIFFKQYVVSVWCFFSAIISVAVYVIIYQMKSSNPFMSRMERQNSPG